ncbi:Zn-dependent amino-/carboxypeptidase, M28 family [Bacteroidales bacterium 6E]|nr:Zn-dependent amino-/carboxypeptidase, M28 family [Bacteroidales bacterium 6E]
MNKKQLLSTAQKHLKTLCIDIPDRSVGSKGNRRATEYFKNELTRHSWDMEETLLQVMDWKTDGATLQCGENRYEVFSSLYSMGCSVHGELVPVSTIHELETKDLAGKIVLLHGDIAREQIMPKNFVFYNPDEHQQIVALLEKSGVKAIICATGHNPALAGGVYPFPMFEDGDFDIPSAYMKDTEGEKLLAGRERTVTLVSKAIRIPETAYHVIGRKDGPSQKKIVITAHIDAKIGTSGAIDNATGVTVLLLLAELLKDYNHQYSIELVPFNGEDYYAVPGQMKYIEQNEGRFSDIILNINIDGAGYKTGASALSLFGLPDNINDVVQETIQNNPVIKEGLPWYQGDHSIFVQYGCPAIAVSSAWFIENMETQDITHTPKDNLDIVNPERLVEIALAIGKIIDNLD